MGRLLFSAACCLALSAASAHARPGDDGRAEIHGRAGNQRDKIRKGRRTNNAHSRRATGNPVDWVADQKEVHDRVEDHGGDRHRPPGDNKVGTHKDRVINHIAGNNRNQHEPETDASRIKYDAHWKNYDGDASGGADAHWENYWENHSGDGAYNPAERSPQRSGKNNGYWIMDASGLPQGGNPNYHTETHAEVIPKARKEEGTEVRNAGNERMAHGFVMFGWGTIFGGLVVYIFSVWNSRNDGRTITVDGATEEKEKDATKEGKTIKEGEEKGKTNVAPNGPAVMESIATKELGDLEDVPISGLGSDRIMSITKGLENNVPVNPFEEVPVDRNRKNVPVNQNRMVVHVSDDSFRLT